MKITAIYPGTFDPITNGHTDIVLRATRLFDQVIVAVTESTSKKTVFSLDERVNMTNTVLKDVKNTEVCSFGGLVTAFAREKNARVIIRGLRAVSDFEYEFQMALMNRKLAHEIETVFLMPALSWVYLSSSLVKDVGAHGGDIKGLVPEAVHQTIIDRLTCKP